MLKTSSIRLVIQNPKYIFHPCVNSVMPFHGSIYFLFVSLFSQCIFSCCLLPFSTHLLLSPTIFLHISLILCFLNLSLINQSLAELPYHFFLLLLLRNPSPFTFRSSPNETQRERERERERERLRMGFAFESVGLVCLNPFSCKSLCQFCFGQLKSMINHSKPILLPILFFTKRERVRVRENVYGIWLLDMWVLFAFVNFHVNFVLVG